MKLRRRNLTLLEVLIAFTLITLCLFPLLSPHVHLYQTQRKLGEQISMSLEVSNWYATFYEKLLKKELPFETLLNDAPQQIPELKQKAWYTITNTKDKKGISEEVYFFKLNVTTENQDEFIYHFVVLRKLNDQTTHDPQEEAIPDTD